MSKKLTAATALVAASAAFAFDTWIGSEGLSQVNTGLDNGSETSGYWFAYNDKDDGGKSQVNWGGPVGSETSGEALDRVITACNGVCGTAVLDKGTLKYNPFVGIGFNVVGEGADQQPEAANATDWGGVCITYIAKGASPMLELGLGGTVDASIGFANPAYTLPKSTAGTRKSLAWSDFKQPSWYTEDLKIDGPTAATQLVALKFKIQTTPGSYEFNICAIGPYNGTCPAECEPGPGPGDPISSVRGASSAKTYLHGRVLGVSGITSDAMAEVVNLQGQVVAKGAVDAASSTLDLASLDAGVYLVRVAGKSVNISNKIVLK